MKERREMFWTRAVLYPKYERSSDRNCFVRNPSFRHPDRHSANVRYHNGPNPTTPDYSLCYRFVLTALPNGKIKQKN
jgi:hypothetical protein